MTNDNHHLSRSNPQSNKTATSSVLPVPKATTLRLTREWLAREIEALKFGVAILQENADPADPAYAPDLLQIERLQERIADLEEQLKEIEL